MRAPRMREALQLAMLAHVFACVAPASAATTWFVHTDAQSAGSIGGLFESGSAKAAYSSDSGATFSTQAGFGPPVLSFDGTPNTPSLTSSFDRTSFSQSGASALAFAAADLASGTLKLSNTTVSTGTILPTAQSTSELDDTLAIHIAGASNSSTTRIPVTFHLDGTVTGAFDTGNHVRAVVQFGGAELLADTSPSGWTFQQNGWASAGTSNATASGFDFSGGIDVLGPDGSIPVHVTLTGLCQFEDCSQDHSHTGRVTLPNLPASVTFTSASGVFLSAAAPAVPEPSSVMLVVLGVMMLAWRFGQVSRCAGHIRPPP